MIAAISETVIRAATTVREEIFCSLRWLTRGDTCFRANQGAAGELNKTDYIFRKS